MHNFPVTCHLQQSDFQFHDLPVPNELHQSSPVFTKFHSSTNDHSSEAASLPSCDELFKTQILDIPDEDLSKLNFTFTDASEFSWEEINEFLSERNVTESGCYFPTEICRPSQTLALVVPYRDRDSQLKTFVYNMHQFLQKQYRAYCIIVT